MKKLKMLSGLPASGKTTFARKLVAEDGNFARINRDDLRAMLYNSKWSHFREKIVIEAEKAIAQVLLDNGQNPVIDDTNLGPRHENLWKDFCAEYNDSFVSDLKTDANLVQFEKQLVEEDLLRCVLRDHGREASVGPNVINKMAARYGLMKWPDKPIVLVDIDGTLANGEHREHHVKKEPKDWDSYFNEQEGDFPVVHIFKWVAELSKDHTIVVVSGRGAEREMSTRRWFNKVWAPNPLFPELEVPNFHPFVMFFRDKGDRRPDDIVKKEMLNLLPTRPVLIIDDRPAVIRMWREQGLKVIPVKGDCPEF